MVTIIMYQHAQGVENAQGVDERMIDVHYYYYYMQEEPPPNGTFRCKNSHVPKWRLKCVVGFVVGGGGGGGGEEEEKEI